MPEKIKVAQPEIAHKKDTELPEQGPGNIDVSANELQVLRERFLALQRRIDALGGAGKNAPANRMSTSTDTADQDDAAADDGDAADDDTADDDTLDYSDDADGDAAVAASLASLAAAAAAAAAADAPAAGDAEVAEAEAGDAEVAEAKAGDADAPAANEAWTETNLKAQPEQNADTEGYLVHRWYREGGHYQLIREASLELSNLRIRNSGKQDMFSFMGVVGQTDYILALDQEFELAVDVHIVHSGRVDEMLQASAAWLGVNFAFESLGKGREGDATPAPQGFHARVYDYTLTWRGTARSLGLSPGLYTISAVVKAGPIPNPYRQPIYAHGFITYCIAQFYDSPR